MELTIERRNFLSGEHRGLGWSEIPENCPATVRESLIEYRNTHISKPVASRKAPPAPKPEETVPTSTLSRMSARFFNLTR
jgi:hypothetical protein